ncbi:hypothetical protein [Sphingomonas bacterium]|uniref:hypothetical protein n=1 Tax=Sphingomonas bacterium TaxID=1895847 RepID=UPI00157754A3|nr:hypothetical protein [Sphingomonas bacterium]
MAIAPISLRASEAGDRLGASCVAAEADNAIAGGQGGGAGATAIAGTATTGGTP